MATRVLIVDDHAIIRAGLRLIVDSYDDLRVAGEASSGEEAMRLVDRLSDAGAAPHVVLMDLVMDGIGGVEATRRIRGVHPRVAVVFLTVSDDRRHLREAMMAGASGYLLKDVAGAELVRAIRVVAAGGRYIQPSLEGPGRMVLTERETEVLRLVAMGFTNREIADALTIGVRTVETHRTHILQKTGLRTRSELVRFAHGALARRKTSRN